MDNQINLINNQNQEFQADLICYFQNNDNNKKYVFYTKKEIVQDGLLKMYVAEEKNGLVTDISPEEWNELKHIMQDIIKGVTSNG